MYKDHPHLDGGKCCNEKRMLNRAFLFSNLFWRFGKGTENARTSSMPIPLSGEHVFLSISHLNSRRLYCPVLHPRVVKLIPGLRVSGWRCHDGHGRAVWLWLWLWLWLNCGHKSSAMDRIRRVGIHFSPNYRVTLVVPRLFQYVEPLFLNHAISFSPHESTPSLKSSPPRV